MILIGLPVYKRDWILPYWFEYIEKQTVPLSELGFIFELGPDDHKTHDVLWNWHMNHPEVSVFDGVIRHDIQHKDHVEGLRMWRKPDYHRMTAMRNSLLDRALCISPDKYFSLDSDILLTNPKTIETLAEITNEKDAVNPLLYMHRINDTVPSVMTWVGNPGTKAKRYPGTYPMGTLFQADVIMGAKMMSRMTYENVHYRWHRLGEDLGWSFDAKRQGLSLWCASYLYAEHIMDREMLEWFRSGSLQRAKYELES